MTVCNEMSEPKLKIQSMSKHHRHVHVNTHQIHVYHCRPSCENNTVADYVHSFLPLPFLLVLSVQAVPGNAASEVVLVT